MMKITLNSVTFAGLKIMKLQTCTLPPQGLSTHTKSATRSLMVQEASQSKRVKLWSQNKTNTCLIYKLLHTKDFAIRLCFHRVHEINT